MHLQLFSIDKLPRAVPVWDTILDDLGRPPPQRVADALGVGRSSVYRWNSTQRPPRMAALALFWLTRWGHSAIHTQATNDAILAVQLARALSEERLQLRDQVAQLTEANEALRLQAATEAPPRGNAAIADRSHTGTASVAHRAAAGTAPLAWPALSAPLPELPQLPAPEPAGGRPGSPEAQPPAGHSATSPAGPRTGQPPLSAPQAVEVSSPSLQSVMLGWRHFDTTKERFSHLLVLRQAQQQPPLLPPGPLAGSETLAVREQNSRLTWRAGGSAGKPAAAPASMACGAPAVNGQTVKRAGTPPSASVASLPLHGASRPHTPAWPTPADPPSGACPRDDVGANPPGTGDSPLRHPRAPGAPPGQSVFAAISTACTTPTKTTRSRP